jgi:hypothetical protein
MSNQGKWVSVSLGDGMIFQGTVKEEAAHGIYLHIGGTESRLSLFPWHTVIRVVYLEDPADGKF